MSKQTPSNQSSISSSQHIASLLQFQQKLLGLIHSQLYNEPIMNQDSIVKFQINHVSQMNELWKKMIDELQFQLLRQKKSYESTLRDHFHKVLTVDFLPFLRINRHELTQVSLFGFDIYVQPLSAILEILNRVDGLRHILNKQNNQYAHQVIWFNKQRDIWQGIRLGWDKFIYQSALFKISLNLYILKEYLKVAAKSLVKKDKEIIFTGCYNLFSQVVPILKKNREIWLLCEFSELNNELYQFHPSFNYSYFYSLMLPLCNQYQPVFRATKIIGQKCLTTNILTPLLFSLLRNRQAYHWFINEIDSKVWAPYLNGIVFGLIYNFKARILQYEESMNILKEAILKLGILSCLQTSYFVGELGVQWREARDFFISALKVGYNAGQLQTWHPTQFTQIQQRILMYTKSSLLMHTDFPANTPIKLFFEAGFQAQLQSCLYELTGNLVNKSQFTSNFSPNIAEAVQINQKSVAQILKLSHLIKLCKLAQNVHCICYLICFLNKFQKFQSVILNQRLSQIGEFYCLAAVKVLQKVSVGREDLKQILFVYMKNHKLASKIEDIISVCLMISAPKQATIQTLSIISSEQTNSNSNTCSQDLCQLVAANILAAYTPQVLSGQIKLKSFDKQYAISSEMIHMNNKLHLSINVLVQEVVQNKSTRAFQILLWIAKLRNWVVIPLLNYPVSSKYIGNEPNKNLQQFSMWLIKDPAYHNKLLQLLNLGVYIKQTKSKLYFMQITLVSICQQIINQINSVIYELSELEDNSRYSYVINLLQLLVTIYRYFLSKDLKTNVQLPHKCMKLFLRAFQKLDTVLMNNQNPQIASQVINSLETLYCPLLDEIYNAADLTSRKWRITMWRNCLVSLDINIQRVNNIKDYQLPSLRAGKGFFIRQTSQISRDKQDIHIDRQKSKSKVESLLKQIKNYSKVDFVYRKRQLYSQQQYLLRSCQIKQLNTQQKGNTFCSKQFLIPAISLKTISLLLSQSSPTQIIFLVDLLAMTPSNHKKLTEWALLNKNKQVLYKLNLSREVVSSLLSQILALLTKDELQATTLSLDEQSKKNISDNFNFVLLKQAMGNLDSTKQRNLIISLSKGLGFLLVYNQSNWRYLNQLLGELGSSKSASLTSIPSLLLQYLQYIRITLTNNDDYEEKVKIYAQILQAYVSLLTQKQKYIILLELESVSENNKEGKKNLMTQEQIELFKVNELGYIEFLSQAWNFKQFLYRASQLHTEINKLTADLTKFKTILETIDHVVSSLVNINRIVNQLSKGSVLCPDFLNSFQMCSDNAYTKYSIQLGALLQSYFRSANKIPNQVYVYTPQNTKQQISQFLNKTYNAIKNKEEMLGNIQIQIRNKYDEKTNKTIKQQFQNIQKQLVAKNVITVNKQIQVALDEDKQDKGNSFDEQQANRLMFLLGIFCKAMHIINIKTVPLCSLLENATRRQILSWEQIKNYDSEAYHHIKSVIIDQQLQSRKLKFVFNNKPLLAQGLSIEVNKLNRQRYCNLVGKSVVGEKVLKRVKWLVQGFYSVKAK